MSRSSLVTRAVLVSIVAVATVALLGESPSVAATARNCTLTFFNAGEQSPYGYDAHLIEVAFCGNRRIDAGELQRFQTTYQLALDHITSPADRSFNIYLFRVLTGTPPDKARQIAADDDVLAVSVESLGQAAGAAGVPTIRTTPNTSTGADPPVPIVAWLAAIVALLLARVLRRASRSSTNHDSPSLARRPRR